MWELFGRPTFCTEGESTSESQREAQISDFWRRNVGEEKKGSERLKKEEEREHVNAIKKEGFQKCAAGMRRDNAKQREMSHF